MYRKYHVKHISKQCNRATGVTSKLIPTVFFFEPLSLKNIFEPFELKNSGGIDTVLQLAVHAFEMLHQQHQQAERTEVLTEQDDREQETANVVSEDLHRFQRVPSAEAGTLLASENLNLVQVP